MKLQDLLVGIAIIASLCLGFLSFFNISGSRFSISLSAAREKSCYANMRVLLGAVEMYNMDNSVFINYMDPGTAAKLHKEGYVNTPILGCPGDLSPRYSNRFFQARMDTLAWNVRKFSIAYFHLPGGFYGGYDLVGSGSIFCSMHGTVD